MICMPPFMLLPEDSTHYWWAQPADGTMRITPIAVGVNILETGDVTFTVFDLSDTVVGTRTISYSGLGDGSELAAADIVITGTTAGDLYRVEVTPSRCHLQARLHTTTVWNSRESRSLVQTVRFRRTRNRCRLRRTLTLDRTKI